MRLVSRGRFQYGAFALEPPVLATCYTPPRGGDSHVCM